MSQRAISDISGEEKRLWRQVSGKLSDGQLKSALDQLLAAASLAPSVREKNRNLLLVAKLCLKAGRPDLALPLVEGLHELIESLHLDQWEHPAWIAEVVETLYRCLKTDSQEEDSERTRQLFRKLCTLNITKAAAYRIE
jgi:type VI secretion system protein ImpA